MSRNIQNQYFMYCLTKDEKFRSECFVSVSHQMLVGPAEQTLVVSKQHEMKQHDAQLRQVVQYPFHIQQGIYSKSIQEYQTHTRNLSTFISFLGSAECT